MKLNEIHFIPKANAVADVYAKATGMPFVGEMMVAAAGQGGNSPEPVIWYIAWQLGGPEDIETSRGTGRQTGVVDEDYGMQELEVLTNNNFPELVGQKVWVSNEAAADDRQLWQMDMPMGTPSGLYLSFYSEEPTV